MLRGCTTGVLVLYFTGVAFYALAVVEVPDNYVGTRVVRSFSGLLNSTVSIMQSIRMSIRVQVAFTICSCLSLQVKAVCQVLAVDKIALAML